ncbi:hypothetical protein TRFO_29165 [Tritrichomonas foetus]|uniref:Uncharacterized protein n=1 Tax=Tritrichomonas foetus TaxID=1144522 RepID=A0A1J4K164_9EUKA|nr:hypothetical protein TRFO_29165 [Tritrichomonas foetus]|eukprot:OHT03494.1 hypothetical protein TRFO_29165 [Tritrichomonas foetus]
MIESDDDGILVTFYSNKALNIEKETFRRICMKYGTRWNLMYCLMPWRTKANWRSTWIQATKQQSISEWIGIRHDPYEIGKIYKPMCHKGFENDKLIYKKKLVNKNEMITKEQRNETRLQNNAAFGLTDEKAKDIDIPFIMNMDYISDAAKMKKILLILRLRQLKIEKARRMNQQPPKARLKLLVGRGKNMKPGIRRTYMPFSRDTSDLLFDASNFNDLF